MFVVIVNCSKILWTFYVNYNLFYSNIYEAKIYILVRPLRRVKGGGEGGGGEEYDLCMRPAVRPTQDNLKFELPSSDYCTTKKEKQEANEGSKSVASL